METVSKKVEELVVGNLVDLESCPFLKEHPSAKSEFAVVVHTERETDDCVVIGYEGIDQVGYPVGTTLRVRQPRDVPDPIVRVQPVGLGGNQVDWKISQNLTDRWGDINDHNAESKPLELLTDDEPLFERLRNQMWDECTFIVRKDGTFGILFEVEFASIESEEAEKLHHDPAWFSSLKPHAEVVNALLKDMEPLANKFPGVQFAVPDESVIINDRPAAWAFVPDGMLTAEQREELGKAMLDL